MTNNKMTQKEAVYQAVTTVFEENGIKFENGQNAASLLTKEMRATVREIMVASFLADAVELSPNRQGDKDYIVSYVPSLITNHLNKDIRLNGGTKHETKNPGSRFGSGDDQLKSLKALKASLTQSGASEKEIAEIDGYIETRTNELKAAKPAKAKTIRVNYEDLPAELQAKYAGQ